MKKTIWLLLTFVLLLTSCGKEQTSNNITGIPYKESARGMWSMISPDGEVIFTEEFDKEPSMAKEGIFMVQNGKGLYEYYTAEKKPQKIGAEYKECTLFSDGKALATEPNKPVAIINTNGEVVKTLDKIDGKVVESVQPFSEGYAVYKSDDCYGVIDDEGKPVIPAKYCQILRCSDGKFIAVDKKYKESERSETKFAVLNTSGKVLFEMSGAKYAQFGEFQNGYLPVCVVKDGESMWGIINDKQEEVVKPSAKYSLIDEIRGDKFLYKSDTGLYGVMDMKGNTIIRAKYSELAFDCNDLLVAVSISADEPYKFIDENDEQVGKDEYMSATTFAMIDGEHAIVKISDKQYSIINSKGEQLKNLPDMRDVARYSERYTINSDYLDIEAMLNKIGITQNGMDGIKFGDKAANVVKKKKLYLGFKNTADDYTNDNVVSYTHDVYDVEPKFEVVFDAPLGAPKDPSEGVYAYSFVWTDASISYFTITFEDSDKLKGKIGQVKDALIARFTKMGKIIQKTNDTLSLTLKNGKEALIYFNQDSVTAQWGSLTEDFEEEADYGL